MPQWFEDIQIAFYASYSAFNNLNAQLYMGCTSLGNRERRTEMSRLHIFPFQTLSNRLCGTDHYETVHKTQKRMLNANNSVSLQIAIYLEHKTNFIITQSPHEGLVLTFLNI